MKIRFERDGAVFKFDSKPMQEGRFMAVCAIAAAALYVVLAIGAAALCGFRGLALVLAPALIIAFMKLTDF